MAARKELLTEEVAVARELQIAKRNIIVRVVA